MCIIAVKIILYRSFFGDRPRFLIGAICTAQTKNRVLAAMP